MPSTRWLIVVLAALEGGWLVFDGLRATALGDYVTPQSGGYAGQLGPWADLVRAVGLDPRSAVVKAAHVGLGSFSLCAAFGMATRRTWAWRVAVAAALGTMWYLPVGTLMSLVQVALLWTVRPGVASRVRSER